MGKTILSEDYDVIVVGAGPAGSSAARAAALGGAKVLLVDRRQSIGVPVQCAELVTQWVSRCTSISPHSIVQSTDTMVTHLYDSSFSEKQFEMKIPGYVLDRSRFDKELATSAVLAGAKLSTATKAVGLDPEGLIVEEGSQRQAIRAKVVVGADGVHSLVARQAGLRSLRTIVALQYEVANPRFQEQAEVFFDPDYEGGYAWFFPKGKTANAGLGVIPSKAAHLSGLLDRFLDRLAKRKGLSAFTIVGKTGGSVPCEVHAQTVFRNILLVGDAAGHAHPITGAGILNALTGGEIAGRVAAEAVAAGDLDRLRNYEMEWHEAFGNSLFYGASKRNFLEKNWNSPEAVFESLIRKTWVGFKEYYEDRKRYSPFDKLRANGESMV
jgi:geranylgeranyl reductase family protein